jgi:molybdopterin-guanine dinucleotide biosynthesis protein A
MARAAPVGAVLAGGAGRRIGGAKATIELAGRPLLHYPIAALRAVLDDVAVVAKPDTALPPLPAGVELWVEPAQPRHPLVGVRCALARAAPRAVLVVPGDLPLLDAALLTALARTPAHGAAAVVARSPDGLQPLCARYEQTAARALGAFDTSAPARVIFGVVEAFILEWPDSRTFTNVNDPHDLRRAQQLLGD